MKVFQVIAVLLIICLQSTQSLQSKASNKVETDSLCQFENPAECGCKIILAYWAPPHFPKKRPYVRRWPAVPPLPKPKGKVYPHVTCDGPEGALFYIKLKSYFPQPIKRKAKKKPAKSNKILGRFSKVVRTVSSSSHSEVKASGRLSPYASKILGDIRGFIRRYHKDIHPHKKLAKVKRAPAKHLKASPVPAKKEKKKKLTYEQKKKLENKRRTDAILKKQRYHDFHALRKMFAKGYVYPYAGSKCTNMGYMIKRACSYK